MENDAESSDSENDEPVESSDDELSFESDEEGNYQQNLNKKHHAPAHGSDSEEIDDEGGDEEEDEDDDDGEEEEDDEDDEDEIEDELSEEELDDEEQNGEELYKSDDDSEDLSFEEDSDLSENEEESSSNKQKQSSVKVNGSNKSNDTKKVKTPAENKQPNSVDAFKNALNKSDGKSAKKGTEEDEYEKHDTDDEEDIRNTVGNIPMHWYDEYKHIGYDWDAKKIIKPTKRDQLDDFLKRMEDPNFWRTVKDPQTGQDVILSDADIDFIKRINSRRVPDADFDDYTVSIYISQIKTFIYSNLITTDHKRKFLL